MSTFDGVIVDAPVSRKRLKYWMPIYYDTIEGGLNKKSLLNSHSQLELCYFYILSAGFICQKYYDIISLTLSWISLGHEYANYENG